jgi:RNA polymerase sigma factor (sigma-70 family)
MSPSLLFLTDDARILEMIREGDEEALVTLYRMNRKAVTSYVCRNNGNTDDAEDMLQEALVVLWERVRSGKFQHTAQLSTFIFATVKNMWLRQLARMRREQPMSVDLESLADGERSALDVMIESEQARKVADALETLGDPCKKLLVLFYWEELSMEQIAADMGFANADTVKSKKYQCKKALEGLLKDVR